LIYGVAKTTTYKDSRLPRQFAKLRPRKNGTVLQTKQIPLCAPRPPKCGGKEKAQDEGRREK
jgi:hypothetical protein